MQQARRSGPLPLRKLYGVHVFKVSRNWSSPTSQVFSIESTVRVRTQSNAGCAGAGQGNNASNHIADKENRR